jgi:hypothetical protein
MAEPIGNNIMEGPLGVVVIDYDGLYLGKTTADTELVPEEDNKDINYQQDGTKPADKVPTGINWMVNATFGEIKNTLLDKLQRGLTVSGSGKSVKIGREIYISRKENAKVLIITRVDSEGDKSVDPYHRMTFYKASPEVTAGIPWGADTQRGVQVSFYIFYDDTNEAFGYYGYASSLGL